MSKTKETKEVKKAIERPEDAKTIAELDKVILPLREELKGIFRTLGDDAKDKKGRIIIITEKTKATYYVRGDGGERITVVPKKEKDKATEGVEKSFVEKLDKLLAFELKKREMIKAKRKEEEVDSEEASEVLEVEEKAGSKHTSAAGPAPVE